MPGYADLADTSALAVQNPAQYGEIVYSVKQVDELSVDLYRKDYASFAVKSPDGSLSYNRLPDKEDQLLDLWIDEQTDLVYCIDDGSYYLLYYMEETGEYLFSKQSDTPQGEGSYHEDTGEETSEEENPEEEPTPFADCYPQGELIPTGCTCCNRSTENPLKSCRSNGWKPLCTTETASFSSTSSLKLRLRPTAAI